MTDPALTTRVFIYGSCVSRDTFGYLPEDQYSLVRYVARQSLISAFAPADIDGLDLSTLTSSFQRRMMLGDVAGSLTQDLRDLGGCTDLILWDLCDERLGVYRHTNGAVVTRSVELVRSGAESRFATWEHIPFGTDDHFRLWMTAVAKFFERLGSAGLLERVALLAIPWATHLSDGSVTPASYGLTARAANPMYERYYRAVADVHPIRVVSLSPEAVTGDTGHRWGPAPFHYSAEVYTEIAGAIERLVQRAENSAGRA